MGEAMAAAELEQRRRDEHPDERPGNEKFNSAESMNSDCSEFCPEVLPTDLEFLEHVGAGHTCEVYRGKCRGAEVAIKQLIMPKHKMVTEETLAREVARMVLVRHPNIVTFFGIVTQVSPLWIIMEYCAGGTAFELLH